MKTFKGTKGNWQIKDNNVCSSAGRELFENVIWSGQSEEEVSANVKLAASAPELLEVSIMVAEMLDFNKGVEIPDDAWNANVSNLWSVINKALGNE